MNLTEATSVTINGKEVKKIQLNGQIVYELINIQLTTNKQHIITGETVNINLTSNVINKEVELFKVIGLTKTKIETLRTDENGQASYTYTGTGAGNVSFVAVYDDTESNTVQIDDYTPYADEIILSASASSIRYGESVTLTATVKDQHGELIQSGTVTFKENGISIGTGSVTSGVATLTVSNFNEGTHSILAEIGNVTSNTVNVNVLGVTLSFGITGSSFSTYSDTPFVYTGNVFVDWGDSTTEEYIDGALTHTYSVSDDYTVKIYGNITELTTQCFGGCDITDADIGSPITTLENMCFGHCTSLSTVLLSDSVTSIEPYCFAYGTALTEIVLEWDTASSIVTYDSSWIGGCSSFDHFLIPEGTTALYEAKGYPSALLVEQIPFDGIDLESDKDIISYNGGTNPESATLTAQLTNGGSPVSVSGETVSFEVRKASDDSLVETLTADTDSSGIATVSYLGKGVGNLNIKAKCNLLIQTYEVQDCRYYWDMTSNAKASDWILPSTANPRYSSNGLKLGETSSYSICYLDIPFSTPAAIECDLMDYSNSNAPCPSIDIVSADSPSTSIYGTWFCGKYNNTIGTYLRCGSANPTYLEGNGTKGATYRFEVTTTTIALYKNDVQIGTTVNCSNPSQFKLRIDIGGNRMAEFKNFKIKPL